jgi:pimeloyl-ACP methyl ester carboxylesterase
MKASFIDVAGLGTRYLHSGEGLPVVMLHPVGLSADIFLRNADAIAASHRFIAPDLVGHGFTDPGDFHGGSPYPVLLEHMAAFLDAVAPGPVVLAGSSFGAQLAALLYFRMPQRVKKLVIIGSGTCVHTEAEIQEAIPKTRANAMAAMADPSLAAFRERLSNLCHDPAKVPEEVLHMQLTSCARPGMVQAYKDIIGGIMDAEGGQPYRIRHRLGEIRVPTLLVWGRQDTRARHERAVEAEGLIPDARLVSYEGCGHLPYVEYPDAFNAELAAFLA